MSGSTSTPVRLRHALLTAVLVVLVALALRSVTQAFFVPSPSMEPTLLPGDHVLVVRYLLRGPRRGHVVVFAGRSDEGSFIKRVIGLPGDSVQLAGGQVLINGEAIAEDAYAHRSESPGDTVHIVPRDHIFLLGDNRDHSFDSREFGFVPIRAVVGRARLVYWSSSPGGDLSGVRWNRLFQSVE
jgi:signal peptidase I